MNAKSLEVFQLRSARQFSRAEKSLTRAENRLADAKRAGDAGEESAARLNVTLAKSEFDAARARHLRLTC